MGAVGLINTLSSMVSNMSKRSLSSFSFLETADQEFTLVGKDGSLATMVRIDGIRHRLGKEEMAELTRQLTTAMSPHFAHSGHAVQVWFCRDPDLATQVVEELNKPARTIADRLQLNLADVFDERERTLPKHIVWEGFYMVLWTRYGVLTKQEADKARKATVAPALWPTANDAQNPFRMGKALYDRHISFARSFLTDLKDAGIRAEAVRSHEAIRLARSSVYPDMLNSEWKPVLPGDTPPARRQNRPNDFSHVLWPRLDDQIFMSDAEVKNSRVVRVGRYNFANIDMSIGPQELQPFQMLLQRMIEMEEFPWRVSFLLEGNGLANGQGIKQFLASVTAFTSGQNKLIKEAIAGLQEMKNEGEEILRFRTSFATWAPAHDPELIEERLSRLGKTVENWGYCSISTSSGDPLAGVMSSSLGLDVASTAPSGCPPLSSALYMLPWNRDASPWKTGSVLFRTPDGRPWPYQPGSSKQTTFIDLIFSPPGYAKSVYLNTTSLALCLSPAATTGKGGIKLPRIAIIDIGPSSKGLISLLQEALPPKRKHEVAYQRLRMIKDHAINPFDTQLGCRKPLPLERTFLVNFLALLATDVGQTRPPLGITDLAGAAVEELYERFNDESRKGVPRSYTPGENRIVDNALASYNINVPNNAPWWSVVDELFAAGATYEASVAQRFAVPRLEDLNSVLHTPQITDVFGQAKADNGEGLISVFQRSIQSALREMPILTAATRFDLGDARVVALDLDEAAPRGGGLADKQSGLVYMLARFTLARDFYLNEEIVNLIHEKYRTHHTARIQRIRETPKRIVYDEFHRTKNSKLVREQVLIDMREGRKWGVHIALASQLLEDFDDEMIDMATGTWIMGAGNERAARKCKDTFGLSNTSYEIVRNSLRGPGPKGAPFLAILTLKDGKHEHLLYNTIGPTELWAFSTTAEDVQLRNRLYDRLGGVEARARLSHRFPGGSAKEEIERRVVASIDAGADRSEAEDGIIDELVEEIAGS